MKPIVLAIITALAAVSAAQESPTLEELEAEREQLERKLEQNQSQIEALQGPAETREDEELREWQRELQEEFDEIGEYLDRLPKELAIYYQSMQNALGELVDAIDEGIEETRTSARERIAAAERRYWGTREHAMHQDRLHELRTRAEELNATEEAAPLITAFEDALAEVETARANLTDAEIALERAQKAADIAARKLEVRLLEIETRQLEESMKESGE